MTQEEKIRELEAAVSRLEEENRQLVSRNLQISDQLCLWYEFRQRVNWLKEEMKNDKRKMLKADMASDAELFAIIEQKLEEDFSLLTADFNAQQLAELLGISQARLTRLFRTTQYKSTDDYLDYLRLLHAMQQLREHPEYGIASISVDSGFNSVRTFQRKMNEAIGMSPVEFRMLVEKGH